MWVGGGVFKVGSLMGGHEYGACHILEMEGTIMVILPCWLAFLAQLACLPCSRAWGTGKEERKGGARVRHEPEGRCCW